MWTLRHRPDKPLRPYQVEDALVLQQRMERDGATIAAHEQGLGKSRIALLTAHAMSASRLLVLCPSIAKIAWAEEIPEWTTARFQIIRGGADVRRLRPDADITVVTYDLLRNDTVREWVIAWAADMAICDEVQQLRGATTKRTRAAYDRWHGALKNIPRVLLMSGTPIVSWPIDLWPHLKRWLPHTIDHGHGPLSYDSFLRRYHVVVPMFVAHKQTPVDKIVRAQNEPDLHARLQPVMLRRRKVDVAKDLPSIYWSPMPIEVQPKHRREIIDALHEAGLDDDLVARMQQAFDAGEEASVLRLVAEYPTQMATAQRVLGEIKAPLVVNLLVDEMSESHYAIGVGYWNRTVGDVLEKGLAQFGVVRVDGATSQKLRQEAVDHFRQPNGPRVFLGQIQACSTALTLVRASRVIMPQLSWTPGDNRQFVARFHRIGQTEPVEIRTPSMQGTMDDGFNRVLTRKTDTAVAVVETRPEN